MVSVCQTLLFSTTQMNCSWFVSVELSIFPTCVRTAVIGMPPATGSDQAMLCSL